MRKPQPKPRWRFACPRNWDFWDGEGTWMQQVADTLWGWAWCFWADGESVKMKLRAILSWSVAFKFLRISHAMVTEKWKISPFYSIHSCRHFLPSFSHIPRSRFNSPSDTLKLHLAFFFPHFPLFSSLDLPPVFLPYYQSFTQALRPKHPSPVSHRKTL